MHPREWAHSGYREIQNPPKRYGIIARRELSSLCGFSEITEFLDLFSYDGSAVNY
jgi:hypothetical protein